VSAENSAIAPVSAAQDGPTGIGGWLILPIIGFCAMIALTAYNLYDGLWVHRQELSALYSGKVDFPRYLLWMITIDSLIGIAVIISAAMSLYYLFGKRRKLIEFVKVHYTLILMGLVVSILLTYGLRAAFPDQPADPREVSDAVRAGVHCVIWLAYFSKSKRVRNTFVN
jgi:hypothetical protein